MPGDEDKWFAAAKEAGLYDEALALASASACDPRTLTRPRTPGDSSGASGTARTRRSNVVRLVGIARRLLWWLPGRPPSEKPMVSSIDRRRCVRWAYRLASTGACSAKVLRGQSD